MRIRFQLLLVSISIGGAFLFYASFASDQAEIRKEEVTPIMYQFLGNVMALQPMMVNLEAFSRPESQDNIIRHLNELYRLSQDLNKYHQLDRTSFEVSMDYLQQSIREARNSFQSGSKNYSRRMLLSSLNACSSCHVQVSGEGRDWQVDHERLAGSAFEKAEFLYALRHYRESEVLYRQIVMSFDSSASPRFELDRALERILSINLRSQVNLKQTREIIQSFSKNQKLPTSVQALFKKWLQELQALERRSRPNTANMSTAEFESFLRQLLPVENARQLSSEEHMISALYASGLIYEFVNSGPSERISPLILYWLATIEEGLQEDYIYSIGDFYLKECITRFPKSDVASLCYLHLEEKLMASFTGSRGVQAVPQELQEELNQLRQRIQAAQSDKE
ncbi:MAG: hypothetical protein EA369_01935 [Bradymonadales bacterium]|nr:MAG: hypothetical protein EA369_01935 [Bradymonadales bacterium]